MKKNYLIFAVLFVTVQAYSQYTTPGLGTVYTFKGLSEIFTSGVTQESENVYVVNVDLIISANDTLELDNKSTIRIGNMKTIIFEGHAEFTPNDTAYITRMDSTVLDPVNPKGIYLKGENSTGTFKNILFEYNGLRASGKSLDVDNCTFTLSNIKLASNAIDLLSGKNTVTNSRFIRNVGPAIGSGATSALALSFKNNYLLENNTNESNRPQINMGAPGDNLIEIIDNIIIGKGDITKVGGIAVGNLLAAGGENNFVIQGNVVKGNRYGITTNGKMNVKIIDNQILDNKYESNPMNGGSGIALYNRNNTQNVMITGNYIEGHLWGITHINSGTSNLGGKVNLGRLDVPESDVNYNPGKNTFKNNGNNNLLYDLYNNTPFTVYAQGNVWNVAVQDSTSIEKVITHKADDPALGQVIFMHSLTSDVEQISAFPFKVTVTDKKIVLKDLIPAEIELYSLNGTSLSAIKNSSFLEVDTLSAGVYVLKVLSDNKMYFTKILL
jgi:hypothetical protein